MVQPPCKQCTGLIHVRIYRQPCLNHVVFFCHLSLSHFKGLRLFFLSNFPEAMFIQRATFIPDFRVSMIFNLRVQYCRQPCLNSVVFFAICLWQCSQSRGAVGLSWQQFCDAHQCSGEQQQKSSGTKLTPNSARSSEKETNLGLLKVNSFQKVLFQQKIERKFQMQVLPS